MVENEIFVKIGTTKYRMKIPANIKIESQHVAIVLDEKEYKLCESEECGCSDGDSARQHQGCGCHSH